MEPHTKNSYVVRDSFYFMDDLIKQNPELFMTTYDVQSLFTNIPLNETINICANLLYPKKSMKVKGQHKKKIISLLELATKELIFLFNNSLYSQIDGVAMGSPLGPTLANVFMCFHESIWLSQCLYQFKPLYYKRYIDNIFILFSNEDHINKFNKYINSRHSNIRFKNEKGIDSSISFLDVLITKNYVFKTPVYRKPTSWSLSHF